MRNISAFCLAFLLLVSGCSKEKVIDPVSSNQLRVFNYLPEETQLLIFMDLNKLKETSFWESYFNSSLEKERTHHWLYNFEKETGISFGKGISQFYTASTWDGNNCLAFWIDKNNDVVKNHFKNSGFFITKSFNNKEYFLAEENQASFYFAEDSILFLFNKEESLKNILSGKKPSFKKNKNFVEIIKKIKNKNHYWIASDQASYAGELIGRLVGSSGNRPVKELIGSIKNISLSAEFSEGVEIESDWGCSSSKKAFLLSSAIKSALAMNLLSDGDPVLQKALDKIQVERNEMSINFHLDLNEADISELKNYAIKKNLDKKL